MRLWPKRAVKPDRTPAPTPGAGCQRSTPEGAKEEGTMQDDLPPVLRARASATTRRAKVVRCEVLAADMVAWMRENNSTGWFLPLDLDEVAEWLCHRWHIQPISPDMLREAIAVVPGVRKERMRLKSRPDLAHIRKCLAERRMPDDRAWLYHITEVEPMAGADAGSDLADWAEPRRRPDPAIAPSALRPDRATGWTRAGPQPDSAGKRSKRRVSDDAPIVIGHEIAAKKTA